jgi:hypothetical protein
MVCNTEAADMNVKVYLNCLEVISFEENLRKFCVKFYSYFEKDMKLGPALLAQFVIFHCIVEEALSTVFFHRFFYNKAITK